MSSFTFNSGMPISHCHAEIRPATSSSQKLSWKKQYTRAVLPVLSKMINLKIERGEFKAEEYEGLLDNLNRYIILNLDDSGLKFEKPVPRLTCDCEGCRQKIRAMKGRMSDAFFHKEGSSPYSSDPYATKNSKISMQSYLYAKAMDKGVLPGSSDFNRKHTRENSSSVFRSQIDKTKRELMEDKMRHKKRLIEQANKWAAAERSDKNKAKDD